MQDLFDETKRLLRLHLALYPEMEPRDCVKLIYQAEFGCGHFLPDPERARAMLRAEWENVPHEGRGRRTDDLGAFVRIHLGPLPEAELDALAEAFIASAKTPSGSREGFETRLAALEALSKEGETPFSPQTLASFLTRYREAGCPAVHHSETFREKYRPAYRVVRK